MPCGWPLPRISPAVRFAGPLPEAVVSDPPSNPPSPAATAAPGTGPEVPPRPLIARVAPIVATVGVVAALLAAVWVMLPLRTETQDCGTPFTFLVNGRVNEYVNPEDPPTGVTRAEAEANNADPCQERAANRALPALIVVAAGTATALAALVTEVSSRFRARRSAHRAGLGRLPDRDGARPGSLGGAPAPAPGTWPPPTPPSPPAPEPSTPPSTPPPTTGTGPSTPSGG